MIEGLSGNDLACNCWGLGRLEEFPFFILIRYHIYH